MKKKINIIILILLFFVIIFALGAKDIKSGRLSSYGKYVPNDIKFGDAKISEKHCNFFVNSNNATFKDMKSLIEFVQKEVKSKTGIEIETEIEIIN